jgi:hypothetical protein
VNSSSSYRILDSHDVVPMSKANSKTAGRNRRDLALRSCFAGRRTRKSSSVVPVREDLSRAVGLGTHIQYLHSARKTCSRLSIYRSSRLQCQRNGIFLPV